MNNQQFLEKMLEVYLEGIEYKRNNYKAKLFDEGKTLEDLNTEELRKLQEYDDIEHFLVKELEDLDNPFGKWESVK